MFQTLVFTPSGDIDATLAISASRCGSTGILNCEYSPLDASVWSQLDRLADLGGESFGIKLGSFDKSIARHLLPYLAKGLSWLIVDLNDAKAYESLIKKCLASNVNVLFETCDFPRKGDTDLLKLCDGILLKGHEAGGFVSEHSSFVLLQKWCSEVPSVPLYIRGGLSPVVAAACLSMGVVGGVLDSQVLLLSDSPRRDALSPLIGNLTGNETEAHGDEETGFFCRILLRPRLDVAAQFLSQFEVIDDSAKSFFLENINWDSPSQGILPLGQEVGYAAEWSHKYGNLAGVLDAFKKTIHDSIVTVAEHDYFAENCPMARELGCRFPIVQGPMTRVSDSVSFARSVAAEGGLPMLAFALLKGEALDALLAETEKQFNDEPWGIGLLGFAPQSLLDEQFSKALNYRPSYAIIAGGRPDQVVEFEKQGIKSFLHVPSAKLLPIFIEQGARRFILEGRECGGHIGPLSSFVLWSTAIGKLVAEIDSGNVIAEELSVLFAGGIHDSESSAFIQMLTAPLLQRGAKVGILMGSAYLFTREIVADGAIVETFQQEVIDCEQTVKLASGPGHASRCAMTPFSKVFFEKRREMRKNRVPVNESREVLDDLIMGRLRIASKGSARMGKEGKLTALDADTQRRDGMYMLGEVATLRAAKTSVKQLHTDVTQGARQVLESRLSDLNEFSADEEKAEPTDIAIVGIGGLLPGAQSTKAYWDNILKGVDAITEIPAHRWDWRLYFDEDRHKQDKIYSRWGGFIDDLAFDPMAYGIPPKSLDAVDPMQLMALEVASRTLTDAGYGDRDFDRENTSIILGASGGAGDVGMQYGLRAELPRFKGELPSHIADKLPEWNEDSFAGILLNVMAGRVANRLNFGGVNYTTDAACASSLTAIYQGVNELSSGRSNFVIAGGVDTVQGPFGYLCFSKTQALSPRGRCNTFDSKGDGIVISEGIAMVALKRLADAERDGDQIYAVIKGVGGSSDGKAKGLTAPLPAGQVRAMRRAYARAGFGPETVGLFEAHGTGTVAGDTAELESTISLVKSAEGKTHGAVVGSVKTMIGHTKATAGVAGLIKAALSLHHQILPPHLGVKDPVDVLKDETCPLHVIDQAQPWLAGEHPRRAACSAFGFGGTNFHVVLEEYSREYRPWLKSAPMQSLNAEIFVFDASSRGDLLAKLKHWHQQFTPETSLALKDFSHNLWSRWQNNTHKLVIVAKTTQDLKAKLESAQQSLEGDKPFAPGVIYRDTHLSGKVAVLFSGQGSQYPFMGRELACVFPALKQTLSEADYLLKQAIGERFGSDQVLSQFIFPRGVYSEDDEARAQKRLMSTDIAQPALGAIEAGLWKLLQQFGVKADMFAGHSYGEFMALHAAQSFDFATLMQLSEARGRFIVDQAKDKGAELGVMAAIQADRAAVEEAIKAFDDVIVANHNAIKQCIISGSKASVTEVVETFQRAEINATVLPVAAAFHSPFVANAKDQLHELIRQTKWQKPNTPVYSNATARPHANSVAQLKATMADHLVQPVEFVSQINKMKDDGAELFIEVGPKGVLSKLVGKILGDVPHEAVAVDQGSQGVTSLLNFLAELLSLGYPIDLAPLFEGRDCNVKSDSLADYSDVPARSKHTWMLNGSSVYRHGDAVKHVGVKLEDGVLSDTAAVPEPATGGQNSSSEISVVKPSHPPAQARPALQRPSHQISRKPQYLQQERNVMKGRRHASPVAKATLVDAYFETMRQFITSQERVMTSYLGAQPDNSINGEAYTALPVHEVGESYSPPPTPPPSAPAPVVEPAFSMPLPAAVPTAPAAPAQPQPVPVAAPVAPAKPAPAPTAPAQEAAPAASTAALSKEAIQDLLLKIVEDTTGYPSDMVTMEHNLEAELGIDSIKRVEIVGEVLKQLPSSYSDALGSERGELNKQDSLGGMVELLTGLNTANQEAEAVLFRQAETALNSVVNTDSPSRFVVEAMQEALTDRAQRALVKGTYVLTQDSLGLSEQVSKLLSKSDCRVELLPATALTDLEQLHQHCERIIKAHNGVAGIVHLSNVSASVLPFDCETNEIKMALCKHDRVLFSLTQALQSALLENACIVGVSGMGGYFARQNSRDSLLLQGGHTGFLKSIKEENPTWSVRAIDVDPNLAVTDLCQSIVDEMALVGGRLEVGYPAAGRTIFKSVAQSLDKRESVTKNESLVVLATGGGRGITAEVLRELAQPGNTLVLTGRRALDTESEDTSGLSAAQLKPFFIAQARESKQALVPSDIQKQVDRILASREIANNLRDFRDAGASVDYVSADVTDAQSTRELVDNIYARYGRLDGVVHGAGIIEDKLLQDKTVESWNRVVETKILGIHHLQQAIKAPGLKFFTVFSSVAGRYGNSGQLDYATANELLGRYCSQLYSHWQGKVNVSALCWGPWAKTTYGAGMVTAQTEAKFQAKGVTLVSPAQGRALFIGQVLSAPSPSVEVICGQGPWEKHEAEIGQISLAEREVLGPLLDDAELTVTPKGEQHITFRFTDNHLYLAQHRIDDIPVVPAAVALELMFEAAARLWPGWHVIGAHSFRMLNGIQLKDASTQFKMVINPPPYGDSEGFDLNVAIVSSLASGVEKVHYRGVLHLAQQFPVAFSYEPTDHREKILSLNTAYGEWLFHGPCFQVIEDIAGLSSSGSKSSVHSSVPEQWLAHTESAQWEIDPAMTDAAAQMSLLWAKSFQDESALPIGYETVTKFRETLPKKMTMHYEKLPSEESHRIVANVYFVDEYGAVVLLMSGLESIADKKLNRIGGTVDFVGKT